MGSPSSLDDAVYNSQSRRELARTTSTNTDSLIISSDRSEATSSGEGSRRRPLRQRLNSDSIVQSGDRNDAATSAEGSRRRPTTQRRPYSDHAYLHRKIGIDTIAEDSHQQSRQSESPTSGILSYSRRKHAPGSRGSTSTSAVSRPSTNERSYRQETSSDGDGKAIERHSPGRPSPGHTWSRTKSGSVWYERLRNSPNRSKDSVSGSSNDLPPAAIVPLRPPVSTATSIGPPYQHTVRVEKSFTKLQRKESPPKRAEVIPAAPSTSRRSSVSPKKIFSMPLQIVRRMSFLKRKGKSGTTAGYSPQKGASSRQLADHKTVLRRNRTAEALRRVNSILRETKIVSDATSPLTVLTPRVMSLSEQSLSSKGSNAPRQKATSKGKSPALKVIDSDPSSTGALETSYTSSQLALRLGAQPNNTPDERATYKIKRSPSAESEEFFKVDISIRGGTSYLPSEARRIHTPPLPQDGPDGRKRGFFFDYNAPRQSQSRQDEIIDPSSVPARSTSRATTIGKKAFLSAGKIVTKNKANDWYDIKLAQLEESEDDPRSSRPIITTLLNSDCTRERSETQTSISEIKKRKEEELLDYSIPEHLPNSPLCPRHPRYWRIVKGKGSQFRGCWMHGVGLWEEGSRWAHLK